MSPNPAPSFSCSLMSSAVRRKDAQARERRAPCTSRRSRRGRGGATLPKRPAAVQSLPREREHPGSNIKSPQSPVHAEPIQFGEGQFGLYSATARQMRKPVHLHRFSWLAAASFWLHFSPVPCWLIPRSPMSTCRSMLRRSSCTQFSESPMATPLLSTRTARKRRFDY